MKKYCAILCMVAIVLALSGRAGASPMDAISWQVYDSFPPPSLNTSLWTEWGQTNTTVSVNNSIMISPTIPGSLKYYLYFTRSLNSTDQFAVKIPFTISNPSGSFVYFALDLEQAPTYQGQDTNDVHIAWVMGDGSQYGINGTVFHSGSEDNGGNMVTTTVTQGWLGYIYDGTIFSGYYDDGTGWKFLWSGAPGWSGPLQGSGLGTEGNLIVSVNQVFFADISPSPVPIPAAIWLLGSGLAGLVGFGRKFWKNSTM